MIVARLIKSLPPAGPLADEWAALDVAGLCEPNTSLEWTRALLATHVQSSDTTFTIVLCDEDRVVAIVPAIIRRERGVGPFAVATLYLVADMTTAHSDILRASDTDDLATPLLAAMTELPWSWDVLRISRLLESGPMAQQLTAALAASGLAHRVRREQPSYFLELEPSYGKYLAGRSSKFRNYLRRKTRQLEEMGRLEVRKAGRELPVEQAYRDLLAIEERSWKHAHGTAISAVPRQREFYGRLCEGAAHRGRLHLTLMYLDDRPIAFDLGVTAADRYSYLKTSFDESLRAAGPATVLRARLVETLIAEGFRCLDFPAEPYQWEKQWTDRVRWHRSLLVFNRTLRGRLYRPLVTLRDWLRPSPDPERLHHVDPRA